MGYIIAKADLTFIRKLINNHQGLIIDYLVKNYPGASTIEDVITGISNPNRENYTYLLFDNDKLIGNSHVVLWQDRSDDMRGEPFTRSLKKFCPNLYNFHLHNIDIMLALGVRGISIDPEYRNRGVGQIILKSIVTEYSPLFVFSETKNPAWAISCSNALESKYETYWGGVGVTAGDRIDPDIIEAYYTSLGPKDLSGLLRGKVFVSKNETNGNVDREEIFTEKTKYIIEEVVGVINRENKRIYNEINYSYMASVISMSKVLSIP